MKRRKFIHTAAAGAAGAALLPLVTAKASPAQTLPQAVWIENGEPEALFSAAIKELGGIEQFITKGDVVVIKPNIGWDRPPELAATTNPQLIAAVVKACRQAGAEEVKIFDRTCNTARRCYRSSRIEEMAKSAGADVSHIRENKFRDIPVKGKYVTGDWPIYRDYLEADKVINIPIAKHHSLDKVTLGLKNLMGVMGGDRGSLHNHFAFKLAEIDRHILPTLTIIDAYRILIANGPSGGIPDHVRLTKTLVASTCTVSADVAALQLFGHSLDQVSHVKTAAEMGLAKFDVNKLNVKKVTLS